MLEKTLEGIERKDCIVEIFGLGYVGFPLSVRLGECGFSVNGIDTNRQKIDALQTKNLIDTQMELFEKFNKASKNLSFSDNPKQVQVPKISIVCVPTPIEDGTGNSNKFVFHAVEKILETSKKGDVIILESSIKVGSTSEVKKIIESKGFEIGQDFGLCFCPERIDPLNKKWNLENIPRVVYASDDLTFAIIEHIYRNVNNAKLHRVTSPESAEIVKSFENAFRLVNISLVNELAILCDKIGVDVKEVIDAAATKPFGFMSFSPGPGAGGHCIPKDPRFLLESARSVGVEFDTIQNAIAINFKVPKYIVQSIEEQIEKMSLPKKVLVCGLAYKKDSEDMRDSPGFKIVSELDSRGFDVYTTDPYYKKELEEKYMIENHIEKIQFETSSLDEKDLRVSCLCIVQDHTKTTQVIQQIYDNSLVPFIYDCQNCLKKNPESTTILKKFGGI